MRRGGRAGKVGGWKAGGLGEDVRKKEHEGVRERKEERIGE